MTEQPVGPRCGNNPNARLTPGDRKALDDFRARLALEAAAKPYIDAAAWVEGDPLMEVIAVTLWKHCARDDKDMPQLVRDDPRTIAAFAAAVARVHAAAERPEPDTRTTRAAVLAEAADWLKEWRPEFFERWAVAEQEGYQGGVEDAAAELRRLGGEPQPGNDATEAPEFTESVIYEVVGDWGVDSADSAAGARAAVAKWLKAYPKCGAYGQQRIYREWPDGSEWYGPWTDLQDAPAAVVPAAGAGQDETQTDREALLRDCECGGTVPHPDCPVHSDQRAVCICGHTRGEHVRVGGPFGKNRLLCNACDPDSTENLVCEEFEAL